MSALLLLMLFGLASMSSLVLYQHRVISGTQNLALELKLAHEAQRSLGRAITEKYSADAKQLEESAAIAHEERLLKEAEILLERTDAGGAGQMVVESVFEEEKGVGRAMAAAKDLEFKARNDQAVAQSLLGRLNSTDEDLALERKQDVDALEMLNKTLVEFETVDQALQARQSALHAKLERLRHVRQQTPADANFGAQAANFGGAFMDLGADEANDPMLGSYPGQASGFSGLGADEADDPRLGGAGPGQANGFSGGLPGPGPGPGQAWDASLPEEQQKKLNASTWKSS